MKWLFSSSDRHMVEEFGKKLTEAGIHCEIRRSRGSLTADGLVYYPELWIEYEGDFAAAANLIEERIFTD